MKWYEILQILPNLQRWGESGQGNTSQTKKFSRAEWKKKEISLRTVPFCVKHLLFSFLFLFRLGRGFNN